MEEKFWKYFDSEIKFTIQNVKFFYILKQQTHINFLVTTTKLIKNKGTEAR